jgi:hypothetical protein
VTAVDARDGGHHLAERAVAALKAVMLDECPLHRVHIAVCREAFDRGDLATLRGDRKGHAHFVGRADVPSAAGARLPLGESTSEPTLLDHGVQQAAAPAVCADAPLRARKLATYVTVTSPHEAIVSARVMPALLDVVQRISQLDDPRLFSDVGSSRSLSRAGGDAPHFAQEGQVLRRASWTAATLETQQRPEPTGHLQTAGRWAARMFVIAPQ